MLIVMDQEEQKVRTECSYGKQNIPLGKVWTWDSDKQIKPKLVPQIWSTLWYEFRFRTSWKGYQILEHLPMEHFQSQTASWSFGSLMISTRDYALLAGDLVSLLHVKRQRYIYDSPYIFDTNMTLNTDLTMHMSSQAFLGFPWLGWIPRNFKFFILKP